MNVDIFAKKEKNFVLWRGAPSTPPPKLIIGQLQPGAPVTFGGEQQFDLQQSADFPDLWVIPAANCKLTDGQVYHYWFEVTDTHPQRSGKRIRVTDPMAFAVDWRLLAPRPDGPDYHDDDRYPAAVVKFSQDQLIPCDAGGETGDLQNEPPLATLPPNNRLVIYELPTAWTRIGSGGERERGVGTFRDVTALVDLPGSTLFRYAAFMEGYDPVSGQRISLSPARQLMQASLLRWMNDFHIDGIRMDTVENVYNWDFIRDYKDLARSTWHQRFAAQGAGGGADERFLVVGEELQEPLDILHQQRLDGLWHESFKRYIRAALIGENADGESFEWTVRKAIDCRNFGYSDGTQAVLYLTSHDVEGFRNERLFNFFRNNRVFDAEKRTKLAFACLLTAVGVPQILAGDEFADQHDRFDENGNVTQEGGKQVDPVNYSRLNDDWRRRIKDYVARLIKFRTTSDVLSVNDTDFIHVDLDGKRILAWRHGQPDSDKIVVVVANFSDFGTANSSSPSAEYRVHNWPATPPGRKWREIAQECDVPPAWVGREPIFPWEAKVYALV